MSTAELVKPERYGYLHAEAAGALAKALEWRNTLIAAGHTSPRVLVARHRRDGRWAVADLDENPDAATDPNWCLHIMVTWSGAERETWTPWGRAVWRYCFAGEDRGTWDLTSTLPYHEHLALLDNLARCGMTTRRPSGHIVASWYALKGDVPS